MLPIFFSAARLLRRWPQAVCLVVVALHALPAAAQFPPPPDNAGYGAAPMIPPPPGAAPAGQTPAAAAPPQGEATEAEAEAEASASPSIVSRLIEGGPLMIPLGVCSLVVLALSLERFVALRRSRVIPRPFVRRFTECVEDGQLSYDEAAEICDEFECPVADVFHAAVKRWGRPVIEIEQAVMDAGDRVTDSLRKFLRVFHAISNIAPLLGLLGTVLGMIEAFETMSSSEALGHPELLASGISMALVTTASGLSVAIPAYLAYMYFTSKADKYLGEIDALCQKVIDSISAEGLETSSARGRKSRRAA
ncbi:MotA/TolQ/ExbB proton channel family protein [Roseimaritima sediminicola]|uniref:MotA/TolQ/ExbB proton channel family protein n=1 Tax=Roseimaritima sediminicola TaxID=2662066 RepID=UPI00129825F4|nr:MotA/TolQ/ExbB proton channel family protein [Roseimaritima sediminicola]